MFAIKFSMEKRIKFFWIAGFFLPAINATVFRQLRAYCHDIYCVLKPFNRPAFTAAATTVVPIFYCLTSLFTWWPHSRISMWYYTYKDLAQHFPSKSDLVWPAFHGVDFTLSTCVGYSKILWPICNYFVIAVKYGIIHERLYIWTELLYFTCPHEAALLTLMSHKLTQSF